MISSSNLHLVTCSSHLCCRNLFLGSFLFRTQDLSVQLSKLGDQNALQKLRERIAQLDQENKNLQTVEIVNDHGDNDTNLDVQSLIERILRLRTMLRDANR